MSNRQEKSAKKRQLAGSNIFAGQKNLIESQFPVLLCRMNLAYNLLYYLQR